MLRVQRTVGEQYAMKAWSDTPVLGSCVFFELPPWETLKSAVRQSSELSQLNSSSPHALAT